MNHDLQEIERALTLFGASPFDDLAQFAKRAGREIDLSENRESLMGAANSVVQAYIDGVLPLAPAPRRTTWGDVLERWAYAGQQTVGAFAQFSKTICFGATVSNSTGGASASAGGEGRIVYYPVSNEVKLIARVGGRLSGLKPEVVEWYSEQVRARLGAGLFYAKVWRYSHGKRTGPEPIFLATPASGYVGHKVESLPGIDSVGGKLFAVWTSGKPRKLDVYFGIAANTKQAGLLPSGYRDRGFDLSSVMGSLENLDLPFGCWISGEVTALVKKEISLDIFQP